MIRRLTLFISLFCCFAMHLPVFHPKLLLAARFKVLALALVALLVNAPAVAQSFDELPAESTEFSGPKTRPIAISANNTLILGTAALLSGDQLVPHLWIDLDPRVLSLEDPPQSYRGPRVGDMDDSGTTVVGHIEIVEDNDLFTQTARWNDGVLTLLEREAGSSYLAHGVSGDGRVVVGYIYRRVTQFPLDQVGSFPFRWEDDEMVELPVLDPAPTTDPRGHNAPVGWANDASEDGRVIVGFSAIYEEMPPRPTRVNRAVRWVDGDLENLGCADETPPDGVNPCTSRATAVSADGNVVVGFTRRGQEAGPMRWEDGVMHQIGCLEDVGCLQGEALAVSANGRVVVGTMTPTTPERRPVAFIWTEADGIRDLNVVLREDLGLDLPGWELAEATAISADGRVVVGHARRRIDGQYIAGTFGWRAVLGPGGLVINSTADRPNLGGSQCDTGHQVTVGEGDEARLAPECTLRAALEFANEKTGRDSISVDIEGAGPHVITLTSPLPALTEPLVLDATTQPDYAGAPLVVVDGSGLAGDGFVLDLGETTLRGLAIGGFAGAGIRITGPGDNRIEACHLGVGADGATPLPNGIGLHIDDSPQNVSGGDAPEARNLISGNMGAGIRITGSASTKNVIAGNRIGTDADGIESVANGAEGIYVAGAGQNVIGGETSIAGTAPGNLIAGNAADGVHIEGTPADPALKNHVLGNSIGLNADGTAAVANGAVGVHVVGNAPETLIGGESATARNVISGNADFGLWFEDTDDAAPALPTVEGNYIGISTAGDALVPNSFAGIIAGRSGLVSDVGIPGVTIRNNLVAGHFVEINLLGRRSGEAIVTSNHVGLLANDQVAREAPDGIGILLSGSSRSIIGEPGKGNVIGGMAKGLVIAADTVFVVGNRIGTNTAGTAARPNEIGISITGRIENADGVAILANTGRKNIIGLHGTNLPQNQTANVISGNATAGIRIGETLVLSGVTTNPAKMTLLSAVDGAGSSAALAPADSNLVVSNFIGVGAGAIGGIGNGLEGPGLGGGIEVVRGTGNQILFNVIGENNNGIVLYPAETYSPVGTIISFNSIGVTGRGGVDGTPRPNRERGIVVAGAKRTRIGLDVSGVDLPMTNVIQHNGAEGVIVLLPNNPDQGFRETHITRNLFADNGGPAIAIRQGSIAGGNIEGVPSAPRLFLASRSAESAAIFGTIDEDADVEMYLSPSCDQSGRGEGARFSQVVSATAGERFRVLFSDPTDNAAATVGAFVTATATVNGTTTSEFSVCSRIADEDDTAEQFVEPGATGIILADLGLEVKIAATSAGAKAPQQRDGGTLYAMRYDLAADHTFFEGEATSDDGTIVEPDAVSDARYWTLTADGLPDVTYSVCLDIKGLPGAPVPSQLVVVHRERIGHPWTPLASTLSDGGTRLCASGLTAFGEIGIGGSGDVNYLPVDPVVYNLPTEFELKSNYPNPFNPATIIPYDLPESAHVKLEVYDMVGRKTATLLDTSMPAGQHKIVFNAGNLASGVYIIRMEAGLFSSTQKMLLMK